MTLRTRLTIGIAAMMVIMLFPLWIALSGMQRLRADTERLRDVDFRAATLMGRARAAIQEIDQTKNYLSLVPSPQTINQFNVRVDSLQLLVDSLQALNRTVQAARLRAALSRISSEAATAQRVAAAGRAIVADSIIDGSLSVTIDDVARALAFTEQQLQEQTRDRVSAVAVESSEARRSAIFLAAGAAVLAVLTGFWLTQSISGPIDELDAGMQAVSEGDFGQPLGIEASRRDEFGRLASSYNSMAMQLRELDRLKAEFVSVASHELKTPINVITGYLQLLKENVYGPLTHRQLEILDTLAAQGKALSRLVRGLLDVSRFEAAEVESTRATSPSAFLGDLERTFRVLAIQEKSTSR
jgi:signal transduction histidine kinase